MIVTLSLFCRSSFVWRMWIETHSENRRCSCIQVILRMKDVDWNTATLTDLWADTRHPSYEGCGLKRIACPAQPQDCGSSFVWRMWIETSATSAIGLAVTVILRMKDVDWNLIRLMHCIRRTGHPSYEGCGLKHYMRLTDHNVAVILRMKDVDWNIKCVVKHLFEKSHPSYEGCGLKYLWFDDAGQAFSHPSYEGCGLKFYTGCTKERTDKSSFVWRMWIEILRLILLDVGDL